MTMTTNTILRTTLSREEKKEATSVKAPSVVQQAHDVLHLLASTEKATQRVACTLPLISVKRQGGLENQLRTPLVGGEANKKVTHSDTL